jgi:hypothetical protein
MVTNITRTLTGYNLSAFLQPGYYRQSIDQLLHMRTAGVITHDILRGGYHKVSAIKDLGYIKTYLMYTEFNSPEDSSHYEFLAEPVVISDVTISHLSGHPHIPTISMDLVKYTGV